MTEKTFRKELREVIFDVLELAYQDNPPTEEARQYNREQAEKIADAVRELRGIAMAEIVAAGNKKVDAFLGLEKANAGKVNYPKREALPEPIRELIDTWVIASGIKPLAREVSGLLMEGQNWLNLGVTGDDIKTAWEYAVKNYPAPPSSPFGLTNTLRSLKAGNLKIKDETTVQAPSQNGKGFYA